MNNNGRSGIFVYIIQMFRVGYSLIVISILILISFCTVVQKARTGADAFDRKQFFLAANLYEKEFETYTDKAFRAKVAYGAAVSYMKMNETALAAQWFKQAADLEFGDVAWKEYSNALIQLGQYEDAIQVLETLQNRKGNSEEIRLIISNAKQSASIARENLNFYTVHSLDLNTAAAEYAPSINPQGDLVFTSDRPSVSGTEIYKWTGRSFSDLFIGNPNSLETKSFDQIINSQANEGTATFNAAGNVIIFTRCGSTINVPDAYCKLMMSQYDQGKWSEPTQLDFQKENINYRNPCFAANDSVIFFDSDDEKGEGKYDIYYTEWLENKWNGPERLGNRINTKHEEKFPFMYNDTLYFASDRPGGLGGLDIYKTFVNEEGEWQPPINLKAPINSNEDDFGLVIDPRTQGNELKGYFSSSRKGGAGKDDIYSFIRTKTDESVFVPAIKSSDTITKKKEIAYKIFVNVRVNQILRTNPDDPNSPIAQKRPMPDVSVLLKEDNNPIQLRTNANGNAYREIAYDKNYFAIAVAPPLLNSSTTFNTIDKKDPDNPIKTINIEINLDKLYTGKEIILSDIYYDLDKWDIRKDAEIPLNSLAQMLKDNPRIRIQLSSHTDCRSSEVYNLELSNKRAKSAVDFLIKSGIAQERLIPKGFGESQLINTCICEQCTEEEHQANRRTTFTILN